MSCVTKITKSIDPLTFQPYIEATVRFNLELMQDLKCMNGPDIFEKEIKEIFYFDFIEALEKLQNSKINEERFEKCSTQSTHL